MSNTMPQFDIAQRCQAMQTDTNVRKGFANVCGVVVGIIRQLGVYQTCRVFLEDGRFVEIDNSNLIHVDEELYAGWKKNDQAENERLKGFIDNNEIILKSTQLDKIKTLTNKLLLAFPEIIPKEQEEISFNIPSYIIEELRQALSGQEGK